MLPSRKSRRRDALTLFFSTWHMSTPLLFLAVSMPRVWLRRPDACVSAAVTWKPRNAMQDEKRIGLWQNRSLKKKTVLGSRTTHEDSSSTKPYTRLYYRHEESKRE